MDVNSLIELIKTDMERDGSYDRYPVRFLSMKYEAGVSDVLIKVQQNIKNIELFDIKDLLRHEDAWITTDRLRKAIDSLNAKKSFIVVGFSEYARFLSQDEFISLLISLIQLENQDGNQKRRLYIPCFALYSQIKKIIMDYHRRIDVYNPLLNDTDVEDLPRIYFIDEALNANFHTNEVVNSAEWFGMWRNPDIDTTKPILCSSKTLAYFYTEASPDNVYNIRRIQTYQDILQYMYCINNLRGYKKDPDRFYSRLINLVSEFKGKSLDDIILTKINAQSIGTNNIYYLWKSGDLFSRWLIQNYVLIRAEKDSYLYLVMNRLEWLSDEEFVEVIYEYVLDCKNNALIAERNEILSSIYRVEKDIHFTKRMMAYYEKYLSGIVQRKTTISLDAIDFTKDEEDVVAKSDILVEAISDEFAPYLTYFSEYERQLIIWLYRSRLLSISQIKVLYPALYSYLGIEKSGAEPEDYSERFDDYFANYRKLRLSQVECRSYDEELYDWNHDENTFYAWYLDGDIEYPDMLLKENDFHGNTYVLDAVGAEFMHFILKVLEENNCVVELKAYGKAHLPSITSVAKQYYTMENEWNLEYDTQVIHGETYYHVRNIEKSLTVIESMIKEICAAEGDSEFAIIADHGSTIGHKIKKKEKKFNFKNAEHDGRCFYNAEKQPIEHSEDYVIYDDESGKQWVIALNQQSLYNNSKYAVHGGATLEEILVPIVIAHKGKKTLKTFRVHAVNLSVSGLHREVEFKINPNPGNEKVLLTAKDGTDIEMSYKVDTKTWIGKLKRGIEQDIEVFVGTKGYKFRTVPTTKMGDDLFDD